MKIICASQWLLIGFVCSERPDEKQEMRLFSSDKLDLINFFSRMHETNSLFE